MTVEQKSEIIDLQAKIVMMHDEIKAKKDHIQMLNNEIDKRITEYVRKFYPGKKLKSIYNGDVWTIKNVTTVTRDEWHRANMTVNMYRLDSYGDEIIHTDTITIDLYGDMLEILYRMV